MVDRGINYLWCHRQVPHNVFLLTFYLEHLHCNTPILPAVVFRPILMTYFLYNAQESVAMIQILTTHIDMLLVVTFPPSMTLESMTIAAHFLSYTIFKKSLHVDSMGPSAMINAFCCL